MRPLATVCVTSIPSRRSLLSRLLFNLTRQPSIELLVADGLRPMGDKLNDMFAAARGLYVVAVDDDDLLSDAYVAHLASTLKDGRFDFVGHDILWLESGSFGGVISHSLEGDPDWVGFDRGVSPKCPVRTEIARRHEFGNHYTADREWSKAVHAECETGFYIPAALYTYDHWDAHMVGTDPSDERASRTQRDVGMWPFNPEAATWLA